MDEVKLTSQVCKVDESLGLVFGWAFLCKDDGADYVDVQKDNIPEDEMLKAALDFSLAGRVAKEMHTGDQVGTVVFMMPLTTELAKGFGFETKKTGLMIAMRPNEATFAKFKDGTYTGFSIGGAAKREEVEVAA